MSKPLAFGLNLSKKPGTSKPAPPKRRPMFGDDDDSDNDGAGGEGKAEEIGEFDDFGRAPETKTNITKLGKAKGGPPTQPPKLKSKGQPNTMFGDLSSSLTSRKNAEAAAEVDASVYEYDSVYDSLKPKKQATKEDQEKRPKYMKNILQAADVRKRDALIAEEKKIAREREAEGEEFADKEKFVTEAYRKQQEENKRLEEEERRREEEEAKKNKDGGMSAFYRKLLDKDEQRHSDAVKAAEEKAKHGAPEEEIADDDEQEKEKTEADIAKELNEKGAAVAINEDGQVVDKRQLLRGGLNVGAKKKESVQREAERPAERPRKDVTNQQYGRKQAQRERQSRMIEEQLAQSMKRSRDEEAAQKEEVERAAKSRKTEGEISSAKERYLARKRAAEEARKAAGGA
ncbi:coiled-coil domain-containing protein 55-domain containing protein [Fusarium redolens]|uniref:Coiled-coil domain-containing protein 55-domain containing protein n=1 Tax=Fusarium redolens TaxID=48865 RepID=A0A9P9R6R2_FUSRE|nr:coiled-coil domain-containing protein 55-domain containing protein [Fusarium redolens]KAH7267443.1 coiled-coil domain-containing protein 55-domain containing protein [Fusarium redolens]